MTNIRTNRHSGRVLRGGAMRRESIWIFGSPDETVLGSASTAALIGTLNAAALALRPFTVVRVRGHFGLRSDQVSADEDYSASLGVAVVSSQAAAIGVTAVPTPETDRGSDLFFVYESLAGHFRFTTGVAYIEAGHWKDFDSKAMRKVDGDQDIAIVTETSAISLGAIPHVSFRMLLKLH